jgi:hypothetical protein
MNYPRARHVTPERVLCANGARTRANLVRRAIKSGQQLRVHLREQANSQLANPFKLLKPDAARGMLHTAG